MHSDAWILLVFLKLKPCFSNNLLDFRVLKMYNKCISNRLLIDFY